MKEARANGLNYSQIYLKHWVTEETENGMK